MQPRKHWTLEAAMPSNDQTPWSFVRDASSEICLSKFGEASSRLARANQGWRWDGGPDPPSSTVTQSGMSCVTGVTGPGMSFVTGVTGPPPPHPPPTPTPDAPGELLRLAPAAPDRSGRGTAARPRQPRHPAEAAARPADPPAPECVPSLTWPGRGLTTRPPTRPRLPCRRAGLGRHKAPSV